MENADTGSTRSIMTIQLLDPQVGRKTSRADAPVTPLTFHADAPVPPLLAPEGPSLISSLFGNVRDFLFPEKLPPLKLTSRPVPVRDIWEKRDPKKAASYSLGIHGAMIGAIIIATILGAKAVKEVQ